MFVKPAPGVKVRDPISKFHIPDEGAEVPESSYWIRRLRSGDVVRTAAPVVINVQIPDSELEGEG